MSNPVSFRPERVFVTVGSTSFDGLIQIVTSTSTVDRLKRLGLKKLTIQTGGYKINPRDMDNIELVSYGYADNLSQDIMDADLIIGHAGAGTCLEVLRCNKRLLVVTNDSLMDRHQDELADQLAQDKYLIKTNLIDFHENLEKVCAKKIHLREFPPSSDSNFEAILNRGCMNAKVS